MSFELLWSRHCGSALFPTPHLINQFIWLLHIDFKDGLCTELFSEFMLLDLKGGNTHYGFIEALWMHLQIYNCICWGVVSVMHNAGEKVIRFMCHTQISLLGAPTMTSDPTHTPPHLDAHMHIRVFSPQNGPIFGV